MTLPCEQHGEPQFIAGLDGVLIAFATAWMNHSRDAVLRRQTHRVIKGEEAITGEDGTTSAIPRRLKSDPGRANPVHLPRTNSEALTVSGHDNGIGTDMTNQLPGEAQVITLCLTGDPLGGHGPPVRRDRLIIKVLHQQAAQDAAHVVMAGSIDGRGWEFQNPEIPFGRQNLPGFGGILRRHHALQEQAGEFTGCGRIHTAIHRHDPPERTDPITIQRPGQSSRVAIGDRHTAGIGVLHHNSCRPLSGMAPTLAIAELPHGGQGCFEIEKIVGAQFLPLQLNGASPSSLGCAVPGRPLMGVLAVAQSLTQRQGFQPGQ